MRFNAGKRFFVPNGMILPAYTIAADGRRNPNPLPTGCEYVVVTSRTMNITIVGVDDGVVRFALRRDLSACVAPEDTSRLWGEWVEAFCPSGTTVVTQRDERADGKKPNLYVYADRSENEDRQQADRYPICRAIRDYLNGGDRPAWLDDYDRTSEGYAESLSGASIHAVGPMIDRNPPDLDWIQDNSDSAQNDRARLMDVLFCPNVTGGGD